MKFSSIRTQLLVANLMVFALVLIGFGGAVRFVFWLNLQQQLTARLTTLAQGAAANVEAQGDRFKVEDDLSIANLRQRQQALQWFDRQGVLIQQQGSVALSSPLDAQAKVQLSDDDPRIQAVTVPLWDRDSGQFLGYVRASQSQVELTETLHQLDWGLGAGVLVGLSLSGIGILWVTRQAMIPIESSFQRLQQFTADASHELRSPLMVISSNAEVALKYPQGMRPDDREALEAITSATAQMSRLTEDLLFLSRNDRPSTALRQRFCVSTLLQDTLALYQAQAQQQDLTIIANITPQLFVDGEPEQLQRAVTNLLQNALCYTAAGGNIWLTAAATPSHLHLAVQDTGIGIAPEHLEKVFERFWRADPARSHDRGGSGLGLAITQAIVERHGGTLTVVSQLGQGSCFEIYLPLG